MSSRSKKIFFTIVILLSIIILYLIFNVGNPNSLMRYIIKDPSYDLLILIILAVIMSLMSFYYAHSNETTGYEKIIQANLKNIQKLRKNGKTDEQIAEAILNALKIRKGYRYSYARKRLIVVLGKVK
jgi:uncharacterized integral membrane protein